MFFTVTEQVAFLPVSFVVQVIIAVPFETPVTTPFESTFATFVLLDFHLSFLLLAFSGSTVATRVYFLPA